MEVQRAWYTEEEADCSPQRVMAEASDLSWAQRIVYRLLSNIKIGCLVIRDPHGTESVFGPMNGKPYVYLIIHNDNFFSRLVAGGSLALGESYMDGWWDIREGNISDFFQILFANRLEFEIKGDLSLQLSLLFSRFLSDPKYLKAAKQDIQSHYDLGNSFFENMLDESMTYSCGYQKSDSDSLARMQEQKYERIYDKLGLGRGGTILDIGCGWGGMLIYAAKRNPNISGIGITLSEEQRSYANNRITAEGLSDRIRIELQDYRECKGSFDFIVSIGMFEHIGKSSYSVFFKRVKELLRQDGVGLLHTIGIDEDPVLHPDPWMSKYIFPGSRLPRLEEIIKGLREVSCTIGHFENLRPHYAATLHKWRENFISNQARILALGFDKRFFRMWDYYLQLCKACFTDSTIELYQVLFCNGRHWDFPRCFDFGSHPTRRTFL